MLEKSGLVKDGSFQEIKKIGAFYPHDYFSPYDYINCQSLKSENTHTMHHYFKSWLPLRSKVKCKIKLLIVKLIGGNNLAKIREVFSRG